MKKSSSEKKFDTYIFGTVDRAIITGTHADIVDFKFGVTEIDGADINIQGQAYLLGVMDLYPNLETATVHFIIPRRDEVLKYAYTKEDMEEIRLRIKVIVERAKQEPPDLRPNTEGCRYCKNRLTCPALSEKLLPLAKKYAPTVEDFEVELYQSLNPAEIEDPEVLGKMLNVSQVLDKWATAVRKQSLKMAEEEGAEIPGYDLAWRNPSMKIENAQEAYDSLSDILTSDEFMDVCSITVAQVAKAYAAKLPRGEKKNARGQVELLLESAGLLEPEETRPRSPYLRKNRKL
tara:strand:+ start:4643 stop:5512 length:870 start_codon:yes stop_codon:yes gene_type:complete